LKGIGIDVAIIWFCLKREVLSFIRRRHDVILRKIAPAKNPIRHLITPHLPKKFLSFSKVLFNKMPFYIHKPFGVWLLWAV